jgi:MoaA/NifB/PqqE/SkfB family radical SAM enzyme
VSGDAPARAASSMFELQLGQLCNDRCVFCISGRITHAGEARLLPLEPLAARLRQARAEGRTALTFLGGEPTIQPHFLELTRLAVELGFSPIVVFTNGSKAGRTDLVDRVVETGGDFEWRFSFQGATEEAHERTTGRRGSWRQLIEAVSRASERGQRITVNTCVVAQNASSLGAFGEALAPFSVAQLHVDMIHPEDTGDLSLDELRPMMIRYTDVVPHLRAMVAGLPPGFDVNVGNVPPCIAPDLSPWIHHGGPPTETSQVSDFGLPVLQPSRDKYAFKERKKVKVAGCASCVFDRTCSGLFPEYAALFSTDELRPSVGAPGRFAPVVRATLERAMTAVGAQWAVLERRLTLDGESIDVDPPRSADAHVGYDTLSLRVLAPSSSARRALERLDAALLVEGARVVHPVGDDAGTEIGPRLRAALRRWRGAAPYPPLRWSVTASPSPTRVEVEMRASGARISLWVDDDGAGYRVVEGELVGSAERRAVSAMAQALRTPR